MKETEKTWSMSGSCDAWLTKYLFAPARIYSFDVPALWGILM